MVKRWKWLAVFVAIGLVAALVIGCGKFNDAKNDGSSPTNAADANGSEETADAGTEDSGSLFTLNIVDGKIVPTASFTTIMYDNPAIKFK